MRCCVVLCCSCLKGLCLGWSVLECGVVVYLKIVNRVVFVHGVVV